MNFFSVTHVVSSVNKDGMCPRTMKYLHAILAGKWIVNFECKIITIEESYLSNELKFIAFCLRNLNMSVSYDDCRGGNEHELQATIV